MNDDDQQSLTPRLRFPEFRDAPGWDETRLDSVADFVGERVQVNAVAKSDYVSTENILADFAGIAPPASFPAAGSVTRFQKNDVLISNIRPYLKKVWRATRGGGASNDVIVIRSKPGLVEDYLSVLLKNDAFIDYVMTGAKGVKMPRGDIGMMHEYPVAIPAPAEQRKIAECLGSLDELIAAEGRKLEALRAHKKGLMQHLFPRDSETRPRLRFPEFRDSGEWSIDRFENLYTFQRNNAYSRDQLNYKGGKAKNVHYGDIHTKFQTHFDIERENVPYINESEPVPPFDSEHYCVQGDLIFADASEDTNDVGKCIELVNLNGERLLSGQHTILARRSDDRLAVGFGGYLFRSKRIRQQIEKEAQGTKVYAISARRLADVEVAFPSDIAEQQRIAACLSSLDAVLAGQSQKLAALRTHKQALMQQLFPSGDSTGEGD